MIDKIDIQNFKCFLGKEINLKKLTVLAGSNSVGKSSIIQAILLSRLTIERLLNNLVVASNLITPTKIYIPLNGRCCLSLGNTKEALIHDAPTNIISFELVDNQENKTLLLKFKAEDTNDNHYELEWIQNENSGIEEFNNLKNEFYYLNAERIGPRLSYDADQQDFSHVGYQGEYTLQIIAEKENDEIESKDKRSFPPLSDYKLLNQIRAWMDYVIPGFYIDYAHLEGKLKKTHASFSKSSPTNVGFGISYVLPIVVNGLVAKDKSLFVVENPEAHLHP
ncbi:MAG: AAA family ATPase, partial [Parafilimonas sp.]